MGKNLLFISRTLYTSLLLLAICILMMASSVHFASSEDVSVTEAELYKQCKQFFSAGNFAEAAPCIGRFRSLYPESEHDGEMLFMQTFLQPAIDTSIGMYKVIIERYPGSKWAAKSYFQLGQCYYLRGEYDKALDYYGKIIVSYTKDEMYWPARYWKCRSLIATGDYENAIKALRSLEENAPEDIGKDMILMAAGNCYLDMKDYENAAIAFRSLIESMPDSQRTPSAHILLAKSLQNLGKLEDAKKLYQKVIESYGQSMEVQQAQECLNSLSPTQSKAAETTPNVSTPTKTAPYFTIQIGAFSSKRNADRLASKLRKKGYSVSVIPPKSGSRLYKVTVGKFSTKGRALEWAQGFGKNEKLDTKLVNVEHAADLLR